MRSAFGRTLAVALFLSVLPAGLAAASVPEAGVACTALRAAVICVPAAPVSAAEPAEPADAAGCPAVPVAGTDPVGGKGGPPGAKCCDPAKEPGTGGNPFCFEGHTCCSDGVWRCNNPDGSPSCSAGQVCAAGCGSRGDSCSANTDCCSGVCKGNGRCG